MEHKLRKLINNKKHCLTILNNGEVISPYDYFLFLKELAEDSHSTALAFSMHTYTVWGLNFVLDINQKQKFLYEEVKEKNKLFASLNEPNLYFTRIDQINPDEYPIKSYETENGFIVTGKKKFASLGEFASYFPVYCLNVNKRGGKELLVLIIDKEYSGVKINNDWDSLSMQETATNSIEFNNVLVPYENMICGRDDSLSKTKVFNYLFRLSICSVYYGMASKSVNLTLEKIKGLKVLHQNANLAAMPGTQFGLAELIIKLDVMHSQIKAYCEKLESTLSKLNSEEFINTKDVELSSLITKHYIMEGSELVVNKAMKIMGMSSLSNRHEMSKIYKDIKASQFHPPKDDIVKELIAKSKLGIINLRRRWF